MHSLYLFLIKTTTNIDILHYLEKNCTIWCFITVGNNIYHSISTISNYFLVLSISKRIASTRPAGRADPTRPWPDQCLATPIELSEKIYRLIPRALVYCQKIKRDLDPDDHLKLYR